ncbi:MAG TPA: type II secretion system protein GspN [Polyangiaceae bacterium]
MNPAARLTALVPARVTSFVATLSPRTRRILRWVGYPLFYLFCLIAFAKLVFPYDRLKERLETSYNSKPGLDDTRLQIGSMSSYWLTGIEAEDVSLIPTKPGKEAAKPTTINHLHASVSVLRWLFGTLRVAFGAEAMGGEVSGNFSNSDDARSLLLEVDKLEFADLPLVAEAVGLPTSGKLDGEIELEFPQHRLSKAVGTVSLVASDLAVGDGKAKIRDTIALPKLNAGKLELKAEAADGELQIKTFTIRGPDLELTAEGSIRLRDRFQSSMVDMKLSFKFTDQYKNRNDLTRGLFGTTGSNIPGAFDLDPKNRQAKMADGSYSWRVGGAVGHLSFVPSGGGDEAPGRPARRRRR